MITDQIGLHLVLLPVLMTGSLLQCTVPLKKFATTAKRQTPSTAFDGFGAAGRLEPSAASRQTPGGVGG